MTLTRFDAVDRLMFNSLSHRERDVVKHQWKMNNLGEGS